MLKAKTVKLTLESSNRWHKQFSIALQRCNAKVILKKIGKLSIRVVKGYFFDVSVQHNIC